MARWCTIKLGGEVRILTGLACRYHNVMFVEPISVTSCINWSMSALVCNATLVNATAVNARVAAIVVLVILLMVSTSGTQACQGIQVSCSPCTSCTLSYESPRPWPMHHCLETLCTSVVITYSHCMVLKSGHRRTCLSMLELSLTNCDAPLADGGPSETLVRTSKFTVSTLVHSLPVGPVQTVNVLLPQAQPSPRHAHLIFVCVYSCGHSFEAALSNFKAAVAIHVHTSVSCTECPHGQASNKQRTQLLQFSKSALVILTASIHLMIIDQS